MNTNWLRMLQALPMYPRIGREALTITFLLAGSRDSLEPRKVTAEAGKRELQDLLTSFVDAAPQGLIVNIYRCGKISQPVAKLVDPNQIFRSQHMIESKAQGRKTVIVDSEFDTLPGQLNVGRLCECLFEELEPEICACRLSYRDGKYRLLDDEDRRFVEDSTLS